MRWRWPAITGAVVTLPEPSSISPFVRDAPAVVRPLSATYRRPRMGGRLPEAAGPCWRPSDQVRSSRFAWLSPLRADGGEFGFVRYLPRFRVGSSERHFPDWRTSCNGAIASAATDDHTRPNKAGEASRAGAARALLAAPQVALLGIGQVLIPSTRRGIVVSARVVGGSSARRTTLALTTPLVFGPPPALQTAIGSTQGGNGGLSSPSCRRQESASPLKSGITSPRG
jgi:hypothetical protein